MTVWEILREKNTESNTKNILLYLMLLSDNANKQGRNELNLSVESLCDVLGLGKGQVYRAQSQLKRAGLLSIKPTYCTDTGKKLFETYEFVN